MALFLQPELLDLFQRFSFGFRQHKFGNRQLNQAHHGKEIEGVIAAECCQRKRKQPDHQKLNIHWVKETSATALLRIALGNISETKVQNTGPMQAEKQAI